MSGNSNAIYNLALHYDIKKNYKYAINYYLIAIEKGNLNAIYNLALYYDDVEKDYTNAVKYYLMAIKKVIQMQCLNWHFIIIIKK